MKRILIAGSWMFAVAVVITADAQTLKQLPEGVALGDEHAVAKGATLLSSYETHQPSVDQAGQVRPENRATVKRFFQLPIGPERAGLYAADGVKQIPHMGSNGGVRGRSLRTMSRTRRPRPPITT
jgi:hypothetical protein